MAELDGPSLHVWNSLRASRPRATNEFSTLPILLDGVESGIQAAMSADGRPHLLIPIEHNKQSEDIVKVSLKGLSIKETILKLQNSERLVLDASSDPTEESMFTVVARELALAVAVQGRDPRKASQDTVKRWQTYWSANSSPLSFEARLGLFAELFLLNRILIPKVGALAVETWRGPHGERHDFQASDWHIESKATTKSTPTFQIHGHDQLDPPPGKELLVFCLFASKESGAVDTIETEIESIRDKLRSDLPALNQFSESLLQSGYSEDQEILFFTVRGADFYIVDSAFPNLGINELPLGVTRVDWEIDLSQVLALGELDWARIISAKI